MLERDYTLYLQDIIDAIDAIGSYINGLDYEQFIENPMVVDAVLRRLEVIGEAAKAIPPEIRKKNPDIPWTKIVGLRNIVIHRYFGIDEENIWEIVTVNIVQLKQQIIELINMLLAI